MKLSVEKVVGVEIYCKVVVGGKLTEKRGVATPGKSPSLPFPDQNSVIALGFAAEYCADFVALSTVTNESHILSARKILVKSSDPPLIVSKIERSEALENFDEILSVSDAIMVARGDMGVEVKMSKLPMIQKELILKCNTVGKPVITATQMLESMINSPIPTRAEVTDVANAIFDGADSVMLSAETAVGENPVDAVRMLSEIIREAEQHENEWGHFVENMSLNNDKLPALALSRAARELAETLNASAVAVFTRSGSTATLVSKTRPPVPIVAFTTEIDTYNQLALLRGVAPFVVPRAMNLEEITKSAEHVLLQSSNVKEGDKIVIIAGLPIEDMRSANIVLLYTIGENVKI